MEGVDTKEENGLSKDPGTFLMECGASEPIKFLATCSCGRQTIGFLTQTGYAKELCDECKRKTQDKQQEKEDLKDEEGVVMRCSCGNPASTVIIGKEAYLARCSDCDL